MHGELTEQLNSQLITLARLMSGEMTTKSWGGPGPWVDSTADDIALCEKEIARLKKLQANVG
jgi:hypothetical protein